MDYTSLKLMEVTLYQTINFRKVYNKVYFVQPEVLWADGAGDAPCTHDSVSYWKAPEFLSWVYNESPVKDTLVANSRWGSGAIGDYQTGGDRYGM